MRSAQVPVRDSAEANPRSAAATGVAPSDATREASSGRGAEPANTISTDSGRDQPPHEPPLVVGSGGPHFGPSATFVLNKELPARPTAFSRSELGFNYLGESSDPAPGTDTFVGHIIWLERARPFPINTQLEFVAPGANPTRPALTGSLLENLDTTGGSRILVLVTEDTRIFQLEPDLTVLRGIELEDLPCATFSEVRVPRSTTKGPQPAALVASGSIATAERSPETEPFARVVKGFKVIGGLTPRNLDSVGDESLIDIVTMVSSLSALAVQDDRLKNASKTVDAAARGLVSGIRTLRDTAEPAAGSGGVTKLERMARGSLKIVVEGHLGALKNLADPILAHLRGDIGLAE